MDHPQRDQLFSRVAGGIASEEIRFPANAGIAGECFTTGRLINIPDAYNDPRFNPEFDRHTGYRTHSILCMPIVARGERNIGVMQILNRKGSSFGSADERRLQAFSAQAAVAIENAQLFQDCLLYTSMRAYSRKSSASSARRRCCWKSASRSLSLIHISSSSCGLMAKARARATRCCSPPDRCFG